MDTNYLFLKKHDPLHQNLHFSGVPVNEPAVKFDERQLRIKIYLMRGSGNSRTGRDYRT